MGDEATPKRRRPRTTRAVVEERSTPTPSPTAPPLTILDFAPVEDPRGTQLLPFFEALRSKRFTTTKCRKTGRLLWPPRLVCPDCHDDSLDWVDLPKKGRIYAFSAVLAGAPLGMEGDVPFAVGLVDLDGVALRIFGRIHGKPWNELHVGESVEAEPYELPDGRVFYRFRA